MRVSSLLAAVEQAQLDPLRVLGEEREVRPVAVPLGDRVGTGCRARPRSRRDQRSRQRLQLDALFARPRLAVGGDDDLASPAHGTSAGPPEKLQTSSSEPRRTRSQRASLVPLDRGGVTGPAARRRAAIRRSYSRGELRVALARELGRARRSTRATAGPGSPRRTRERGELAPAPLAGRRGDLLVDVVGEELERRPLAVLLAHEQHRRERCQQRAERGQRARLGRQPVAVGAVADLVVVLRRRRRTARPARRRRARRSGGRGRSSRLPVVHVRPVERLRELGRRGRTPRSSPRGRRSAARAARGGSRRPRRRRSRSRRGRRSRITRGSLSPHSAITSAPGRTACTRRATAGDEVLGVRVDDRVDRVEAQAVDVEVAHPALGRSGAPTRAPGRSARSS